MFTDNWSKKVVKKSYKQNKPRKNMFKFLKEKIANWTKRISKEKTVEGKPEKKKEEKTIKESPEKKLTIIQEKPGFLEKITSKISKTEISPEDFEKYKEDFKMLLLENNVAYKAAEKIIWELERRIVGKEFLKKEVESVIKDTLRDVILELIEEPFSILNQINENTREKEEPYVILFVGINGTGKTTTIAKMADYLKRNNISSVIAAADTFRAASIEQLKKHGESLKVKIISQQYGADPASVGFDAISYAKKNHIDCVLIDTAGRMHTAKNLMREIEKISKVCKPDLKLFIGESTTGNDSIEQAESFNSAIGIDGVILTKADVDEKGGTALSISYILRKPILFLGTGQKYNELEPFSREKFVEKLGL